MSASTSKVIAFPDSMERQWGVFERELRAEYLATNSDLAELDHVLQQIKPLYIEQATPKAFVMNNPDEVLAEHWRDGGYPYKNLMLLGKDNTWKSVDLGLVHSSAAKSIVELVLNRLRQDGDIEDAVSPNFLARNWPPAFKEWSTKAVRDAFFASPQFPRLLNAESLKETQRGQSWLVLHEPGCIRQIAQRSRFAARAFQRGLTFLFCLQNLAESFTQIARQHHVAHFRCINLHTYSFRHGCY